MPCRVRLQRRRQGEDSGGWRAYCDTGCFYYKGRHHQAYEQEGGRPCYHAQSQLPPSPRHLQQLRLWGADRLAGSNVSTCTHKEDNAFS